jgi:hypothetical protein
MASEAISISRLHFAYQFACTDHGQDVYSATGYLRHVIVGSVAYVLDLCLHVQSLAGNAAPLHKMQVK